MRLPHLARLASAGLIVAAALTTSPSYAESQTVRDAAQDVYKEADGAPALSPGDKARDIVKSKASYGNGKLVLWVEVRSLATDDYAAWFSVKTSNGHWTMGYDKESAPAYTSLFDGAQEVFSCDGLRGGGDRRRDRITITVPRSCIDAPRWIKFGVWMRHDTNNVNVIDDGRIDAGYSSVEPKLGSRVTYN
ncbi:hypothetical protein [Nocardioides stalactiti]|uniref:hypothetical protein n=1 Tax=Nocardioides stalactiti TaxID=2755356 RepID=UPI0015FEE85B|nr:hypothetical protein [Nocardioides stalactiti]